MSDRSTRDAGIIGWLRLRVTRSVIRQGSLGIADQAVISGSSFLVMILAARSLGPAAFGVFALLYMIMLFVQSFHESLIGSAHNVIGATKHGKDYQRYTSAVAVVQSTLAFTGATVLLVAGALVWWVFDVSTGTQLMAMALAAVAWQHHEFMRKVLYTESRFGAALANDTLTHGVRLGLIVLAVFMFGVTSEVLFILFFVTWSGGALVGGWQIRDSLTRQFAKRELRDTAREHWQFGRWVLGSNIIAQLPRYVTATVMSSVLSVGAYGAYRAFSQLVNGTNIALFSMSNLVRPRLARDARRGPKAVWQTMLPIMTVGGAALIVFAALLITFRELLLELLFGPEYVPYAAAMFLLTLTPIVSLQNYVLSVALQAVRQTRPIFMSSVVSAMVGSIVGSIALLMFGLAAAGGISLIGACTSFVWLGRMWRKHITEDLRPDEDLQQPTRVSVTN